MRSTLPGGVAGRGDEEGDPGGEGEHGGRDEVDEDVLTVATFKMDLQASYREVIIRAPGLHSVASHPVISISIIVRITI